MLKIQFILAFILLAQFPLLADEPAQPIDTTSPNYPSFATLHEYDGWVDISYVIETDGKVSNAFVVDSSGYIPFEQASLEAIKNWQYHPATKKGKAIQQSKNGFRMIYNFHSAGEKIKKWPDSKETHYVTKRYQRYKLDIIQRGRSNLEPDRFSARYKKIQKAINKGDLNKAQSILDTIGKTPRSTLRDEGKYWLLKAYHAQAIEDKKAQLTYLNKAMSLEGVDFKKTIRLSSLNSLFRLQLNAKLYRNALKTYERISQDKDAQALAKELKPWQDKIQQLLQNDSPFVVKLTVGERGFISYQINRQDFSLVNISGKIDKIQAFCQNKMETFAYKPDGRWSVPTHWGQCTLYIFGQQQSSFGLVEYPGA